MMRSARIRIFLFFLMFGWFFNLLGAVLAAPMPPEIAVNDETRQCAQVMRGDECMNCYLPEGWEVLGLYPDEPCPDGYEMIDLDLDCITDYDCREITGQDDGSDDLPRLTLIGIALGLACFGLVVVLIGIVLVLWLLRYLQKPEK